MSSPFLADPVGYAGQYPDERPQWNDWSSLRFHLGVPGSMVELPSPDVNNYQVTRAAGRVVHQLAYGNTVVSRWGRGKRHRTYSFAWPRLSDRDRAVIDGFDDEVWAPPWCFVPPEDTNRLTLSQSLASGLNSAVEGWTPTSGTAAHYTAVAAPIAPSGVMQWSGQSSGARLVAGLVTGGSGVPDTTHGLPNIPVEPFAFSVYARAVTGTAAAHVRATGMNADGSGSVQLNGPTGTLDTNWRILYVAADAGTYGTLPWLVPSVVSEDGAALLIACPQASFTDTPVDWVSGSGVPRVAIGTDLQWTIDANLNGAATLTLTEAWPAV